MSTKNLYAVSLMLRKELATKFVITPVLCIRVAESDDAAIGSAIKWASQAFAFLHHDVASHLCVQVSYEEIQEVVASVKEDALALKEGHKS